MDETPHICTLFENSNDVNLLLRIEAIGRHKEFLYEYRQALKRWKDGDRDVIFPAGTYALRIHAGVKCEPG